MAVRGEDDLKLDVLMAVLGGLNDTVFPIHPLSFWSVLRLQTFAVEFSFLCSATSATLITKNHLQKNQFSIPIVYHETKQLWLPWWQWMKLLVL